MCNIGYSSMNLSEGNAHINVASPQDATCIKCPYVIHMNIVDTASVNYRTIQVEPQRYVYYTSIRLRFM